jgi:LysR substrate binding domain
MRQRERAREKWGTRTHHWKQCTQPTTLEFGLPIMFLKSGIGLQLVDSHRNGVLLGALSILESGKRVLNEQTGEESRTVSLGFLHSLGIEMVPRLIKEFRRKHPRIQFTLLVQRSGEMLMEELVVGSIDLCLSVPGMFEQSDDAGAISWTKNC